MLLGKKYFEEQLQRIREIHLSGRKFYQKITDIYITSIDYDPELTGIQRFFTTMQSKLHWMIHGHTTTEVIYVRVDAEKVSMGLSTWKDAPKDKIYPSGVVVTKNYLTEDKMV